MYKMYKKRIIATIFTIAMTIVVTCIIICYFRGYESKQTQFSGNSIEPFDHHLWRFKEIDGEQVWRGDREKLAALDFLSIDCTQEEW